jgi:hypothetical protein
MLSDLGPTTFALLIETIAVPESLFLWLLVGSPAKIKSRSSPMTAITKCG